MSPHHNLLPNLFYDYSFFLSFLQYCSVFLPQRRLTHDVLSFFGSFSSIFYLSLAVFSSIFHKDSHTMFHLSLVVFSSIFHTQETQCFINLHSYFPSRKKKQIHHIPSSSILKSTTFFRFFFIYISRFSFKKEI